MPCLIRHGVDLPARTNVALFIRRAVRLLICRVADLTVALPVNAASRRGGWVGVTGGAFSILAKSSEVSSCSALRTYHCWECAAFSLAFW
jgi:hypothetical protein